MKKQIRIPEPKLNKEKAKQAILYILSKRGSMTKKELGLMLYFIDFNYYEKYEEHIIGFTYVKK